MTFRRRVGLGLALLILGSAACNGASSGPVEPTPIGPKFVAFRSPRLVIDRLNTPVAPPYAVGSSPTDVRLSSSDPSIVSVDAKGSLVAHRNGAALVRGPGNAVLHVEVLAASTLAVTPTVLQLHPGVKQDIQILADGKPLRSDAIHWQTTNADVATGFGQTVHAGSSAGVATLTAMVGTAETSLEVKVQPAEVEAVTVEPGRLNLRGGAHASVSGR